MPLKAIADSDLSDASPDHAADAADLASPTVTPTTSSKPASASASDNKAKGSGKPKASGAKPDDDQSPEKPEKEEKGKQSKAKAAAKAKSTSKVLKRPASAKAPAMRKPSASSAPKEIRRVGKNWYKREFVTGIVLHYTDGTKHEVLRVRVSTLVCATFAALCPIILDAPGADHFQGQASRWSGYRKDERNSSNLP